MAARDPTPAASVVISARNAAATLGSTLAALAAQDGAPSFEVIVVDNGSEDETAAVAAAAPLPVRVLAGPGGRPGAARNLGVEAARAPVVAFTDADCVPAPDWLAAGLPAISGAALVQGAVRPDPEAPLGPFDRTLWVVGESGLYETANLFVRRDAFDAAGGFEDIVRDELSAPFGEDTWLGWRVRRAGGRTRFAPEAVVFHAVHPRRAAAYVAERRRATHFPALVRRMPELRRSLLRARLFLGSRSAAFDLALAALVTAAARRSPLPLAGLVPYGVALAAATARHGRNAPRVAAVELAADAVTMTALLRGSVRERTPVL